MPSVICAKFNFCTPKSIMLSNQAHNACDMYTLATDPKPSPYLGGGGGGGDYSIPVVICDVSGVDRTVAWVAAVVVVIGAPVGAVVTSGVGGGSVLPVVSVGQVESSS